jgi:hypothetical protein
MSAAVIPMSDAAARATFCGWESVIVARRQ